MTFDRIFFFSVCWQEPKLYHTWFFLFTFCMLTSIPLACLITAFSNYHIIYPIFILTTAQQRRCYCSMLHIKKKKRKSKALMFKLYAQGCVARNWAKILIMPDVTGGAQMWCLPSHKSPKRKSWISRSQTPPFHVPQIWPHSAQITAAWLPWSQSETTSVNIFSVKYLHALRVRFLIFISLSWEIIHCLGSWYHQWSRFSA